MKDTKHKILLSIGFLIVVIFSLNMGFNVFSAYNFEYLNVSSRVNVTNSYPGISRIAIDPNILLNAGSTKTVYCNVTIYDWNNYSDIKSVNATFWDNNTATFATGTEGVDHYTNTSCTVNGTWGIYYANYTCGFNVIYYANNGTNWMCNISVQDFYGLNATAQNTTSIQAYYALNVTPTIDFGDMAVGDTKYNITSNITNFGNMPINVSVKGFGGTNNVTGAGLAMICSIRNISISNLKYSINDSIFKTSLTGTATNISGLTVPKRTAGEVWNTTYWDLYIPPVENPFGLCNGTVVFQAWAG